MTVEHASSILLKETILDQPSTYLETDKTKFKQFLIHDNFALINLTLP